jgi:osmotically-inducible protein OsmY
MDGGKMDEHLASRVRDALAEDPRLNVLDVEVRIVADALHLHGSVASPELIEAAECIARELAPAHAIINRLTVYLADRDPDHERIR